MGNDAFNRWVQENGNHVNVTVKTIHYNDDYSSDLPSNINLRDSFPNVRRLSLGGADFGELGWIPNFSVLGERILSLELWGYEMNFNQLADYLQSFPSPKISQSGILISTINQDSAIQRIFPNH